MKQKSGAVTVLALLVSLLFGYAPAAAQVAVDGNVRLGPTELVKRSATLRTSVRTDADDTDPERLLAASPPRVQTDLVAIRPAGTLRPILLSETPRPAPRAYRARAPPAA